MEAFVCLPGYYSPLQSTNFCLKQQTSTCGLLALREEAYLDHLWNTLGRAFCGMTVDLGLAHSTYVLHIVESGILCANPQARKATVPACLTR